MGILYNLLARSFTEDAIELKRTVKTMLNLLDLLGMNKFSLLLKDIEGILQGDPLATEEYVKLFERGLAPPYESNYTCKENSHQKLIEEADISGFYRAFGMKPKGELPDHLVAELEFIALLYTKESYALLMKDHLNASICQEARVKFLVEHLSKWIEEFKSKVIQHTNKALYRRLLELIALIVSYSLSSR
ncbi:MAG: molecular chaperone TorD family protein [Nitrososphaerales archaeon]